MTMSVYNLQKLFVKCQFMKLLNFKKVEWCWNGSGKFKSLDTLSKHFCAEDVVWELKKSGLSSVVEHANSVPTCATL